MTDQQLAIYLEAAVITAVVLGFLIIILILFLNVLRLKREKHILELKSDRLEREKSALELDRQTGVYRKEAWEDRLKEKLKEKDQTVCLVDLDRLKYINDNFGHVYGDKVIALLISTLQEELRDEDLIGRYSLGDEFLIALDNPTGQEVNPALERIREKFEQTAKTYLELEFKAKDVCASFSYGVLTVPRSTKHTGDAHQRADDAPRHANDRPGHIHVRERDLVPMYIELDKRLYENKEARKLPAD